MPFMRDTWCIYSQNAAAPGTLTNLNRRPTAQSYGLDYVVAMSAAGSVLRYYRFYFSVVLV